MAAQCIDGKAIADEIFASLGAEVDQLAGQGFRPGLAVVLVGEDPASKVYVRNKQRACERLGIASQVQALPTETTQEELLRLVRALGQDASVDGILVQLPLPGHISDRAVIAAIDPDKDVDCFTWANVGRVTTGDYRLAPCTPAGCIELLERSGIAIAGRRCVVLGRSNIVGKPMALLLLERHGTVTICHSRTQNLAEITRQADILVAAVGRPRFVTADMVRQGAAVIDVGIHRDGQGGLCGDVDFDAVRQKVSAISPVPGGVGPMTIAMLMKNTVRAARLRRDKALDREKKL
jgi:methylenetetrahydrofolate dehydrogenase (NADP+)/methenyltetrahydrofolate cyclohydrolase